VASQKRSQEQSHCHGQSRQSHQSHPPTPKEEEEGEKRKKIVNLY
jgi:hypothetical protein